IRTVLGLANCERSDLEALDGALHELADLAERPAHRGNRRLVRQRGHRCDLALRSAIALAGFVSTAVAPTPLAAGATSALATPITIAIATPAAVAPLPSAPAISAVRALRRLPIARHRDHDGATCEAVHLARHELLDPQLVGPEAEECPRLFERGLAA